MQIKYSELRRDYTLDYSFSGETITATYSDDAQTITDTFDFSAFAEGDEFQGVDTDIPAKDEIIKSAERIAGVLYIELLKPYGENAKWEEDENEILYVTLENSKTFHNDWQEVG